MGYEFTVDEIREAVTIARIYSSGLTEEQFQGAIELQKRVGESGCLEAVQVVARLERERNISFTEVLDACEHLLQEEAELEQKVADHGAKLETLESEVTQAQDRLHQLEEAIEQAREERQREEKGLAFFKKKAEGERQRIDEELEHCRQEANVTREETVTASRVKAEVEKHGFSLKLALDLSQEFAGHENAREELAKGMEEHGSLTKSKAALIEQNKRLKSDLSYVQSEVDKGQTNYNQLERISSELRAEIAGNEEIVSFYHRYLHLRPLIKYLGSWYVNFCHCSWCGCLFWILKLGSTKKTVIRCPWCGLSMVESDRNAYAAIGQSPDTEVKLLPGE